MHTDHQSRVRESLWRLGAPPRVSEPTPASTPLLLKTPAIAVLWMGALLTLASLLAIGRMRVPHVVRGAVVAVRDERDSVALLLLVPASERRFIAAGQEATIDVGPSTAVLPLASADPVLIDAATARREFRGGTPSLIAQLDAPKLAVRLARCGPRGCLTPRVGDTFAATARLGVRSLASYALSRS
jgi:hypothetical protein